MTQSKHILVLCTCPSQNDANTLATTLVEARVAACVNQLPGIKSVYRWEGQIHHDDEILLLIKTSSHQFERLEQQIKKLHPHTTPEIIALPIVAGSGEYLRWIDASIR